MTPTPDQVAQWAREAGIEITAPDELPAAFRVNVRRLSDLHRLVTRAMAEQSESDASRLPVDVLADCVPSDAVVAVSPDGKPIGVTMTLAQLRQFVAAAIRANAPKVNNA